MKINYHLLCLVFLILLLHPVAAWDSRFAPDFQRNPLPLKELSDDDFKLVDYGKYTKIGGHRNYCADLNDDSVPDYVIGVHTGGCGLNAGAWYVIFMISSPQGMMITETFDYSFEAEDIIWQKGKKYYIMTAHIYSEKTKHYYWNNRIFTFGKDGRLNAADRDIGWPFPSFIWHLNRDNHKQSVQLSDQDKSAMWQNLKEKYLISESPHQPPITAPGSGR